MTIIVTGGAGFIGSNFIFHMLNKYPDYRIICLDCLTYAGNLSTLEPVMDNPNFRFVKESITDRDAVYKLFEEEHPDMVVNFAAESHVDRSIENPEVFLDTNIKGTAVLMDACRKYGIKRYHQVSTDEVYGDLPLDRPDLFFTEETPIHTSSPYSSSKAGADLLVLAYHRTYGLPVTISRCSNNYGPYHFPEKLIPLMIANALNDKPLPVYGKGENVRDWLYVEDHCRAIDLIIHNGRVGEVYNVGGHNEMKNIDIVKIICKELGKPESLITYVADRKGHDMRYAIDPTKIHNELGWLPETKFADGIKKTMDYKKSEKANVHLIYGITGSGKTEVYMDIIDKTIHDGKQAIVLIPEIALTYQTVKRFTRRFKDKVSIINSKLSAGEKYDQFERAKRGEISIIIGPRSALFTPFENLGLIVIDEEHEGAYKSENVPKYHAREVAAKLCNITGATLVLGSATPSLESYFNAQTGKYKLHRLTSREKGKLAQVSVVDMREELKNDNKSMFSMELKQLINDRLEKKQQTMLFINRRGYAGFVSCRECGEAVKCPHCDVTLKAHNNGKMVCHYCGYEEPIPRLCPKCGSKYIAGFGIGTQKVETMIKKEFPQAKVLRMDFDTTSRKGGHEEILSAFANHQADILVGTQMIVKGHDFPDVTLVGILAADMSLYASDYTAAEKTFQLLTQAAGRAGRGKEKGQVVIQTYSPDNYSIESAAKQDYEEFYQEELAYRQLMQYPPVAAMTEILIQSEDEELLDRFTDALTKYINKLKEAKFKQLMIIGPAKPPVAKINDVYRRMIYLKSLDKEKLIRMSDYIQELINTSQKVKGITLQFNVRE